MNAPPMQESSNTPVPDKPDGNASPWRLIGWLCAGVVFLSVLACVIMAVTRSTGLTKVTVTALDGASEPRDHKLPLIKQKEALPDYELVLVLADGERVRLGAKPDTFAVDGLTWHISDLVSTSEVASVRLQEQDKVIPDAVAEVQITGDSVTEDGYRFDFSMERSASVGFVSFFSTPVGQAIAAGFCIAVLLMVASAFCA